MTDPVYVNLPGAFAEWLKGTGVAQGQDPSDLGRRFFEALNSARQIRRGRSHALRVPIRDREVALWIDDQADLLLSITGSEDFTRAEKAGAKRARERVAVALAELESRSQVETDEITPFSYAHQDCRQCKKMGRYAKTLAVVLGCVEAAYSVGEHRAIWTRL